MLKCSVCDHQFTQEELFENHEIVVSKQISPLIGTLYIETFHDAYNCPKCKHQNIIDNERFEKVVNEKAEAKNHNDKRIDELISRCIGRYDYLVCQDSDCELKDKCLEYSKLKGTTKNPQFENKFRSNKYNCYNCEYHNKRLLVDPCLNCENYSCFEIKKP